jgi:hypothetical protein
MSKQKPTMKVLDDVSLTLQDIGYKSQHTKIQRAKGKIYVSIIRGTKPEVKFRRSRSQTSTHKDLSKLFKQIALLFVRG